MGFINDKHEFIHTNNIAGIRGKDGVGFKLTPSGVYDMNGKAMYNIKTQADVPDDSDFESIKHDYESGVNKEYLNNHFLKRDKTGVYYDLRGLSIQNSEDFDQNSSNNKTLINKGYLDSSIHLANTMNRDHIETVKAEVDLKLANKADLTTNNEQTFKSIINVPDFDDGYSNMSNVVNKKYIDAQDLKKSDRTEVLLINGVNKMTAPLDMNNQYINNISTPSTNLQGANKAYVDLTALSVLGDNKMLSNLDMNKNKITNIQEPSADSDAVTKKFMIENTTQSHVSSIEQENVFDKVMTDHTYQLSEENDIELGALVTYQNSLHKVNKKAISIKLLLDGQKGYYSSRLGINMYTYDIDFYTMIIEIFFPSEIDKNTVDISVVAVYENINKVTTRVDDDHCRTLVQFHKNQQHGNNYLYQDIIMKMKPKQPYVPKLQCHLIIYGIKTYQSNVDSSVYDALWYIDNSEKLGFNTPITLQNQSISGVKDAKNDDDGVNYKQLNTLEATLLGKLGALQPKSYYNTIFEYFFNLLNPSEFTMSDSFGAVLSGLGSNLVFQTTKLLKEFKPRDGFTGVFIVNLTENVTGSDDWTIYIAFKYDYKSGDNKRIKIELGNDGSFDFPWVKLESGKLFLDYDLDVYSKQIRDAYIGEYLNLWYTKIAGQFRIAVCNNAMSIDQTFSGFNINASNIKITSDYHVQRIGFSKSVYSINNKEYHKIQFLDKTKGVFFE